MVSFLVSSKCAEALNAIFNFIEMEGDGLFRHMPSRQLSLLAIENMLKHGPAVKSLFSKCGIRRMSFSHLEIL